MLFIPVVSYGNISLSPFFLEFTDSAKSKSGQLRFTNTSNQQRTYDIKFVNFKQERDGSYTPIDQAIPGNPFADKFLDYSPRQVTLKPMESQVVRVQRRGMATATDGEYVSHLLIQERTSNLYGAYAEEKSGLDIQLEALYGVSIPVMIEKGRLSSDAKIQSAKIIKSPTGDATAEVPVTNLGNRSFYGSVVIKEDGKEIGSIQKFRIFMTAPTRVLKVPLNSNPKKKISVTLIDETKNETLEVKTF